MANRLPAPRYEALSEAATDEQKTMTISGGPKNQYLSQATKDST